MIRKRSVILYAVIIIAILGGILYGAYRHFFGGIAPDDSMKDFMSNGSGSGEISGSPSACIALFGVDVESEEDGQGRSDAIMLAAIDTENKDVRLCSIARDTRVEVEGHGKCKLNAAYAYGGGELALRTINDSFGLHVAEYVAIDFSGMADVVDELGGVRVGLSEAERNELARSGLGEGLESGDSVLLNGAQAVAYSRIRSLDSDDVRTSRQREVLQGLLAQVKETSPTKYIGLFKELKGLCTTNLSQTRLLSLITKLVPNSGDIELKQYAIPSEQTNAEGGMVDGAWYYVYDTQAAGEEIRQFLNIS